MADLEQLRQAYESLRTIIRTEINAQLKGVQEGVKAGDGLEEVQPFIDNLRTELGNVYTQMESILAQLQTIEPRPDDLIAQVQNNVTNNRVSNFDLTTQLERRARENSNKRAAETAAKASADQGPGTASAGGEVTGSGQSTQSPATAGTEQNADGTVTTAPATNTPSNAQGFQPPGSTTVQPAASALPGTSAPTASGAVPTVTGTPVAGSQAADAGISPGQSDAALSYIYKAVTVTSVFERGRFTQDLEGVLLIFPDPPRKTVYRDSDDNLAYEYTPDDNLAYEGRPGSSTATTPPVLTGPVSQTPNAQNLAQAPESSTGEPAPASDTTTDTVAPAETSPATSASEPVAAPPANQPPEFKFPGGYVTQIPPGVTRDPNSGAWIYRDGSGEEVMFIANTNEALAAKVRAYDTGENVKYVDYDRTVGWVYETFDPNTQIREIVGPAPDPYAQPAGTPAPSQNMAREN